ncbi:TetR/AcrR family transcriptional regulator [Streptomyces sp. NPDC050560]|uniref:TetR/AcrR family transcriptional regulator n=1 Tax=Streptomyces sp. NPDC050560 TaxID=3365630 RepID=UPI0037A2D342
MSGKQHRGEATVERLLDAALRVYLAQGEKGFTVTAVRDLSGVSMGSLYHHFGSLRGLRTALAERWTGVLITEMTTALQQHENTRDAVHALVGAYMRFVLDNRDAALFLHMADTDRDTMTRGRELRDLQEARLSPLEQWVRPRIASGELADLPLPLIESLLLAPIVATARRWLAGIHDMDLAEATRILPERIWLSVSAGPTAASGPTNR